MAKEILGYIKLQIPAGSANPAPPVGPALGQKGLNIQDFCKQFNDATSKLEKGAPIPTIITAYKDRTFEFITNKLIEREVFYDQCKFTIENNNVRVEDLIELI